MAVVREERAGTLVEEASQVSEGEAFTTFFDRLLPRALVTTARIVGTREGAEDAAVEAFGRAFARWEHLSSLEHRDGWLLRVASNVAYDEMRKTVRQARRPPVSPPLADAFDNVDLRLTFVPALRKLTRRQREAVVLTHIAGLRRQEIATLLGCSEESVKTHLRRGMRRLRAGFEDPPASLEAPGG